MVNSTNFASVLKHESADRAKHLVREYIKATNEVFFETEALLLRVQTELSRQPIVNSDLLDDVICFRDELLNALRRMK